ncbi:hypothetical protein [Streptococcus pluranimalium]|uniref:Uncharacterized protein n=1 Tax=Streptococcus pluranimalium TaxID=82348 RepID=A0A345VJE7_9STRE|nr:hypothetical protein [Streptococcus pluranimalium]AXJ12849.1 hypothetical protein Sp14A_09280 [Streptococcus pluranimalium]
MLCIENEITQTMIELAEHEILLSISGIVETIATVLGEIQLQVVLYLNVNSLKIQKQHFLAF